MTARQLELEAALEMVMLKPGQYMCSLCKGDFGEVEDPPTEREEWFRVKGVAAERITVLLCPACANPSNFTIGQRVRFVACPSRVGVVTATGTDPETGQPRYQLEGREGGLGCWYVRDDLEEAT